MEGGGRPREDPTESPGPVLISKGGHFGFGHFARARPSSEWKKLVKNTIIVVWL